MRRQTERMLMPWLWLLPVLVPAYPLTSGPAPAEKAVPGDKWTKTVNVEVDGKQFTVAIRRDISGFIPGDDQQTLTLRSSEGRSLGTVSCGISNRLTTFLGGTGTFTTELPAKPEVDGALLVIRYRPRRESRIEGNWSHTIEHGGKRHEFVWRQDEPGAVRSAEWEKKGLCRVGIRDGKFVVLFPRLEKKAR